MVDKETKGGYEHYCPMVKPNPQWKERLVLDLVRSIEELKQIFEDNKNAKYVAWDTETNGLDADKHHIVGFSFSFNGIHGWYVPIRHLIGTNLDATKALKLFRECLRNKQQFLYNMRFDVRMFEREEDPETGKKYNFEDDKIYDVQVGVFLSDTNEKRTGLKLAEKRFLGWSADTFEETLGSNMDFSYVDPEDGYEYASVDAVGTFQVAQATLKFYAEAKLGGRIMNEVLYPFMKGENSPVLFDKEMLVKCQTEVLEELKRLEHEIMSEVGYVFKLTSNKQLGDALQSLGINTGVFTKTGAMKVDIKTLEDYNLKDEQPILGKIVEHSKMFKLYNSYICPLIEQCELRNNRLRFSYKHCCAPTSRVACGKDGKNTFFAPINAMAIPKPHPKDWYVHDYKPGDEILPGELVVKNWLFSTERKSDYITEGFDQHLNMRSAFLAEDGHYCVGMDYCQHPDTLISTPKGKIKIRDLRDGDLINTPEGPRPCVNPHYTGEKEIVEIVTKSGKKLRVSQDHRIVVQRGRKREIIKVSELRVSDKVVEECE